STLTITGLAAKVTYYFKVAALNWNQSPNYTLLGSTRTIQNVGSPPTDVKIFSVYQASSTLTWSSVSSENGYSAEASTTNFGILSPGGAVYSSATPNGVIAQLTIFGLDTNTTYYLRTGSIWGDTTSYAEVQSTSTLAQPASGLGFQDLFFTSATVSWAPLPLSPPDASSKTAEGYLLEASTASNFTGTIFSSKTANISLSTLSAAGLGVNATYYFRVGALNWNSVASYALLRGSSTLASFPDQGSPLFTGVYLTSLTAQWTAGSPANPAGTRYRLDASSTGFAAGTVVPGSATFNLFGTVSALLPNTTYQLRVSAINRNNIFSTTALGSTSTLANAPQQAVDSFLAVFESSITAAWTALPASPPDASSKTAEGYLLEASSTNFGAALPGGTVYSSQTPNVALANLAVSGLERNTTYYFRAASLNWNSAVNFAAIGSTVTLAQALSGIQLVSVFETSGTVNWVKLPSSPQAAASEGYLLEASSTNFGALSAGGIALASSTPNVGLSTLTVQGLERNTTYYYRAGALNWASAANFLPGSSSATLAALPGSPGFSGIFTTSASVSWTPVDSSGYELQASLSGSFGPIAAMSSTTAGGASGLSVAGLSSNTTYYLRAGSINKHGIRNFAAMGSTSSLALPPSSPFFPDAPPNDGVFVTSATLQWGAVASQGYVLEASTAPDFSGTLISSSTPNGASVKLMALGLDSGTTYYFRAGSLNWNSVPSYAVAGATQTKLSPKSWVGGVDSLWNTAGNWSPSGVPGKNDSVTIAVAASIYAVGTEISFSSLTLGSAGAGAAAGLTLSTTIKSGGDVLVHKGAGLTIGTTSMIKITGDFTLMSGSSLSHLSNGTAFNYEAGLEAGGLFDLKEGATMTAVGRGYAGGAVNVAGSGPGAGGGTSVNNTGGGGAGHGAAGSAGTGGSAGAANDSASNPIAPGSGGGGGRVAAGTGQVGGSGGGLFIVNSQTMRILGLIDASGKDGVSGAGSGGGGSGGGVNFGAQTFEGTGTLKARGGSGGSTLGGGGAGGRIAVSIAQSGSACGLTYDVAGGTGTAASGGNGTVSSTDTLQAPGNFTGVIPTTWSIHWRWNSSLGAGDYQVFSSTGGLGQSPVLSAITTSYTTVELAANTTHSFLARCKSCGTSADSALYALATLAKQPLALEKTFTDVSQSSVTVAWAARLQIPQSESAEGYRLEGSSTAFVTGTLIVSSQTPNVLLSTLTLSGLLPNTTYYFRVASINWASALSPYTSLGSTSTLADRVKGAQFAGVFGASMTANWVSLPSAPPDASSKTAEGYLLQLSMAPDFTGTVFSSSTPNTALSTLSISGLLSETTYYARVAALNWNSAADFVYMGFAVSRDTTAPSAIANLAAQTAASSTTLNLSWSAPGDNG
ncbi:MAG: hypothetical protein HY924_07030, partial [Elusimicrobia bacterium]|nr:hypothetical protein [Elusimicrobiota bacterium]